MTTVTDKDKAADAPADLDAAATPDALWAEMDAADNPEGVAAAAEDAKAVDEWSDGKEPPADGKEPAQAEAEAPAEGGEEAAGDGQDEPDPWVNATPEQLEAWQKAQDAIKQHEQYRKSNEGRIRAFQRQIDELKRAQAAAPQGEAAEKAATKPAGAADAQQEAAQDAFASEGWKNLEEEYPEIAQAVRSIVDPLTKEVGPLKEQIATHMQTVQEDRRMQESLREQQTLTELMPDWLSTIQESQGDFGRWVDQQPRYIQEAVARNREHITDADEAADVIGRYKQHRQATQPPAQTGSPATQPSRNDRRARQLQSSASVESKAPPAKVGIPDDPEGAWDAFERMGL